MDTNSSKNIENTNSIEDVSIFNNFIDKKVNIEAENCIFIGLLRSIDGYLNSVLHNAEMHTRTEPKENIKMQTCFIRGVTVKHISIIGLK